MQMIHFMYLTLPVTLGDLLRQGHIKWKDFLSDTDDFANYARETQETEHSLIWNLISSLSVIPDSWKVYAFLQLPLFCHLITHTKHMASSPICMEVFKIFEQIYHHCSFNYLLKHFINFICLFISYIILLTLTSVPVFILFYWS